MYAAFNTLQLELERLILLRESITISGQATKYQDKLHELNNKIYSHEKAIALLVCNNQDSIRLKANALRETLN